MRFRNSLRNYGPTFCGAIFLVTAIGGCSTKQTVPNWFKFDNESIADEEIGLFVPYDVANSSVAETGKPMMLFFTGSDWCTWCVRLQDEVFLTPAFAEWANQNVVMVEVDFPQTRALSGDKKVLNEMLKTKYDAHIKGFPTALFVDADGRVIGKLGYEKGGPKAWIEKAEVLISAPAM